MMSAMLLFLLAGCTDSINTPEKTVTFSDANFADVDWSVPYEVLENGATHTANRVETGGNPGAFRQMNHTFIGLGHILVFHQYNDGSYNPSTQGPIDSLDYSEDRIYHDPLAPGYSIGAKAGIVQNGVVYLTEPLNVYNSTWETRSLTGLTADDFVDEESRSLHPDFSSSGGEILFGYVRANTNTGGNPYSRDHGIDNWVVVIHYR